MRVEVRTCNQVRIMLDLDAVKNQRRIINGDHSYFQIKLNDGKTLDLEKEIFGLPLEPDIDIGARTKNNFLNRLTHKISN